MLPTVPVSETYLEAYVVWYMSINLAQSGNCWIELSPDRQVTTSGETSNEMNWDSLSQITLISGRQTNCSMAAVHISDISTHKRMPKEPLEEPKPSPIPGLKTKCTPPSLDWKALEREKLIFSLGVFPLALAQNLEKKWSPRKHTELNPVGSN